MFTRVVPHLAPFRGRMRSLHLSDRCTQDWKSAGVNPEKRSTSRQRHWSQQRRRGSTVESVSVYYAVCDSIITASLHHATSVLHYGASSFRSICGPSSPPPLLLEPPFPPIPPFLPPPLTPLTPLTPLGSLPPLAPRTPLTVLTVLRLCTCSQASTPHPHHPHPPHSTTYPAS